MSPLDLINNTNNVDNGYNVLHPELTDAVLCSVPHTLQALAEMDIIFHATSIMIQSELTTAPKHSTAS
jgi:hypothetical protein